MIYDPSNWYWIVAGDQSKAWSSAAAGFVDADDAAAYVAWLESGGGPTPIGSLAELTDVFAAQHPAGMLATYAADKRWKKEVGGITVSGVPVATDDRSKQMILGARVAADADDNFATEWVGTDGNIYPLTAEQVVGISNAVLVHVASCFQIFATVMEEIESGAITTREEIDAAFAG
jgi:hypothetical protein